MLTSLKTKAKRLKQQTLMVYFAVRDPRTPLWVRVLGMLVAAYALSPIDLIPDFIPVLGYLDDLLLIPLGIVLVVRFIPPPVLEAARERARQTADRPVSYTAAALIVALWLLVLAVAVKWLIHITGF